MNIPIQFWLNTQKLSQEASSSFNESFACFKTGANKAALLFAYLGFMNVIRDRILSSPIPTGIAPVYWQDVQGQVRTAETWDKAVFDAIQKKNPAPIFLISDDIRNQVGYWKDRRNDCAHSKQNKIVTAHVEAFYAFIESNLGKFVINGSRNEILSRILDYFNPSLTPPNQPLTPIIHDLPNAVLAGELVQFLNELCIEFDNLRDPTQQLLGQENPAKISFFASCFQEGTVELQAACTTVLLANDGFLLAFLRKHPDRSYILQNNHQKVRQIWHDYLFRAIDDDFPLLGSFLRLSLIPADQLQEALSLVVSIGTQYVPSEVDDRTLSDHGFYEVLENAIINGHALQGPFDWSNKTRGLIVKYLSEHPITRDLAIEIFNAFNGQYYPWHLAEYLNNLFQNNPAKKAEYLAHVGGDPYIGVPLSLTALNP